MKRIKKFFWQGGVFLLAFCLLAAGLDFWLTQKKPVESSSLFSRNDFEKTILSHGGETVYNKVIFGNSVIISAYFEEQSTSGYVNFGLDYGVMTDLRDMLKRGDLTVTEDLVIALNYFVFLDTMDTNPTYPWHRHPWEPYLYFQRDRLHTLWSNGVESVLSGGPFVVQRYENLNKYLYSGVMDDAQMEEKIATHRELYWGLGLEYYQENLDALREVIDFCSTQGIRLRAVWMPWNPYIAMPDNPAQVRTQADEILQESGIEILDLENALPRDCFHDLGHLNMEHGAIVFTEEIETWLLS